MVWYLRIFGILRPFRILKLIKCKHENFNDLTTTANTIFNFSICQSLNRFRFQRIIFIFNNQNWITGIAAGYIWISQRILIEVELYLFVIV